ncbi:sensor histidine kinase [Embleya hyalina]|uniref:sensor histidine kinase n=1 Tax=Embleya hyalina TaxID=516124 RepID=UPI001FE327F7|nr:histidine kinase [Embleya hyalina]
MFRDDWRRWRGQLGVVLRPDAEPVPLSRRARYADLLLAVVLTFVALVVAARYPDAGPGPVGPMGDQPMPPEPREPPELPGPWFPPEEDHRIGPGAWPLVVLSALPLAARRRYPLAAFAVMLGATMGIGEDHASWINVATCVLGAYSAVVHSRYRGRAVVVLGLAAVLAGAAFRDTAPMLPGWSSPGVVLLVAGGLAGLVLFWQRQLAAGRQRYADLERAQAEATRRAVEEERSRIAAELHDVVTHNVSVMVIQAGAARTVMDAAPERSKAALLAVEAGGRAAMAELRHVMGLLAAPDTDHPDELEPQPGLDRLDALIARVRAAGTPVRLAVSLPPEPLPPGVDLTAYRVVQEALTNTIKHAPGADAHVTIGYTGDRLEIEVTDTGVAPAGSTPVDGGSGRGLLGLRERLAVYAGELTAGPTLTGGYRIRAHIPWRTA